MRVTLRAPPKGKRADLEVHSVFAEHLFSPGFRVIFSFVLTRVHLAERRKGIELLTRTDAYKEWQKSVHQRANNDGTQERGPFKNVRAMRHKLTAKGKSSKKAHLETGFTCKVDP